MAVEKGDKVKVDYIGTLEDGTIFDKSEDHGEPMEFTVGEGQLIPGFEEAVIGMEIGDEKEINLKAEEAYGEHNPELVREVPRDQFPEGEEIAEEMMVIIGLPNGMQVPALIKEIKDDEVILDLNHPLAGKDLTFQIKLVDIVSDIIV